MGYIKDLNLILEHFEYLQSSLSLFSSEKNTSYTEKSFLIGKVFGPQ